MTKKIHNLVVSSIKRSDNNTAGAKTRAKEINTEELTETTVDSLTTLFVGGGMKTGIFSEHSLYERYLRDSTQVVDDGLSVEGFRDFSHKLAELLAKTLNEGQAQQAKDGFLVSYVYSTTLGSGDNEYNQTYLCSVFLHRIEGVDINDDLDFEEIERINLDNLALGARVCIDSLFSTDPNERPITFKISGRSVVNKFFLRFLGGEEPENSAEDTKRLKEAIELFANQNGYDSHGIESLCDRAKLFCKDRIKESDGYVNIEELSSFLFTKPEHKEAFISVLQDQYSISETFLVNNTELNKFNNLYIKTSEFTIQFKSQALSTNVDWNPKKETLTFSKLPKEAIEQILLYLPSKESEGEESSAQKTLEAADIE